MINHTNILQIFWSLVPIFLSLSSTNISVLIYGFVWSN